MAGVAAWECERCGQLRFSAEGSTDPRLAPYAKPHVCDPKAAEEIANPLAAVSAILREA